MSRKNPRTSGVNCKVKKIIGVKQESGHYKMERIHSKGDRPLWEVFSIYFRGLEIGQEFTRVEMLENTYNKEVVPALRGSLQTVDTYRAHLRRLGMISHIKPGLYKKEINLPKGIPLTKIIKAMSSMRDWQGWFIPLHIHLDVDESELK